MEIPEGYVRLRTRDNWGDMEYLHPKTKKKVTVRNGPVKFMFPDGTFGQGRVVGQKSTTTIQDMGVPYPVTTVLLCVDLEVHGLMIRMPVQKVWLPEVCLKEV